MNLLDSLFLIKDLKSIEFSDRYKLENLELSAEEIVAKIAILRGCLKAKGALDYDRVYKLILSDFRKGEFGKCCFGTPPKD